MRFAPTCQGSTTKRAEPFSGCPAAKSYLTAQHSHGLAASLSWLHWERHSMKGIRKEMSSQSHLGMVNLSYVANKGELSGSLLHCLVGET